MELEWATTERLGPQLRESEWQRLSLLLHIVTSGEVIGAFCHHFMALGGLTYPRCGDIVLNPAAMSVAGHNHCVGGAT